MYPVFHSRFVFSLKLFLLLMMFVSLIGCTSMQNNRVFHTNGVYIQKGFSYAGIEHVIYQFIDGNKVYTTRQKSGSEKDVLAWVNKPNRNAWEYTFRGKKIKVNTHVNDFARVRARKHLENGGTLAGSDFYSFSETGKLKFERKVDTIPINTVTDIYSNQGKHLLTAELSKFDAVGDDLFILKYADHSELYDAKQNKTLLSAQFITSLKKTNHLFMAYQTDKFGIVDGQGNTVVPFVYDDMMYLGEQLVGLQLKGRWIIRDLKSKQQISLNQDELPVGQLLANNILPIRHQNKIKFYSQQNEQYLKFFAKRYARVPSFSHAGGVSISKSYFRVAKKTGQWLVLRSNGLIALPMYVSAAHHINNYLLVTDTKGVSTVFDQHGKAYSKAVNGHLSPTYMEDYALKPFNDPTVLLKIKKQGKQGIADLKGNILLNARFKEITYIGNDQFVLDDGKKTKNLKIYTAFKGLMTLPIASATYLNGDTVIAQNQKAQYGLWNLKQNEWLLPPNNYSLIKKGDVSRYLIYQETQGLKQNIGALKQDGTIVLPAQAKGAASLNKDYFYQKQDNVFSIYHLPDLDVLARLEGDSMTIEHDRYFVVKRAKE
ncbi:WG repeat-containing protein [Marinomonas agarivorans]|nr:WG repeat-containing protein [Marinomonas agarivorans]